MLDILKKIKLQYVLGAVFVSFLGITSFASATSVNVSCPGGGVEDVCTPNPIFQSSEPVDGMCFNFDTSDIGDYRFTYCLDEDCSTSRTSGPYCVESSFDKVYIDNSGMFDSFDFVVSYEGNSGGGNEGGNEGGLLPNGVSEFTPIINGLSTSINEFIPYVVYVGFGVLSALIGFFAIKRLLRYIKGNTLSVFSSRKKKKNV